MFRPSAAGYHVDASSGSNKGPSNPKYLAVVKARRGTFLLQNPGVKVADVPAEWVTASGTGLDPHLSPPGVLVLVPRVARTRQLDAAGVLALVQQTIEPGTLGPDHVNVLKLNLALDVLATE